MFGKFKEKLKNWAKKISKEEKEEPQEVAEESEEIKVKPKKETKKPKEDSKTKKPEEPKKEEKPETEKETKEPSKAPKEPEEKEGFFSRVKGKVSKIKITEEKFEIYAEELQMLLLENNVAYEVSEKIIQELKEQIVGKELLKKEIEIEIKDILKEIIEEILIDSFSIVEKVKSSEKPYVILFCGVNGTGKTTSIAKVAKQLQEEKLSCVLAAADTFRAASIEQIKEHGNNLGIKVISHEYGSDPASVGFDSIKYAQKNKIDCVIIDTAGRMHTEKNLLKELEKINRVCKPNIKIFVGEATTGNDSIEQVKSFNFAIDIDGIILTKADTDEKGGTALSLGYITKKPILYLGVGQEYKDLLPFNKEKFIEELGL